MRVYFSVYGTLDFAVSLEAGMAGSPGVPPSFYPPHMNVGLPVLVAQHHTASSPPSSPALLLRLVWMNMSLNPWLSDFHAFRFSSSSHCILF